MRLEGVNPPGGKYPVRLRRDWKKARVKGLEPSATSVTGDI
jgi:hypothetical protein